MLCPKCNNAIIPGAKFCGSCGTNLSATTAPDYGIYQPRTFTIGRSSDCAIVFSDKSVSRKHCSVEKLSDGTFFLRDLQSKNGTFVDGIQVKQKHISNSSKIRLGNLSISGSDILSRLPENSPVTKSQSSSKNILFFIIISIIISSLILFIILHVTNTNYPNTNTASSALPQDSSTTNLMRNIENATVIICAQLQDGNFSLGSGFFVNERTIITNRHVIENARSIITGNKIIGIHEARIIAVTHKERHDLAALDIGKNLAAPLPLSTKIMRNDRIYAWGYPGILVTSINWNGLPEVVSTSGEVNVVRNGATSIIVHSAKISPGNSGGPLVNEKGCVVGINTLLLGDNRGLYYISYASTDIILFLNSYGIKYNVR